MICEERERASKPKEFLDGLKVTRPRGKKREERTIDGEGMRSGKEEYSSQGWVKAKIGD